MGIGPILSTARGIPDSRLLCVFNDSAGKGRSGTVAAGVWSHFHSRFRSGDDHYDVTLYPTQKKSSVFGLADRRDNILRIAELIGELTRTGRPLKVLSFGGDGTFQIVIGGYLTFLFGGIEVLPSLESGTIATRLKSCPIRLGIVPTGAANDMSDLYGAPKPKPKAVVRYLAQAVDANIHLGMAVVQGKEGQELWPFVHSFAAGPFFTPILVEAALRGLRGKEAMYWMLRNGVGRIFGKPEPCVLHWKRSDGSSGEMPAQDSMAHALPRLAVAVGLPGLPSFDGIGFKTVPDTGLWDRLRIGRELFGSGLLSRVGRLMPLSAGARLAMVPEDYQQMLNVSEWIEFYYTNLPGARKKVGYQISGDGIDFTGDPIRIYCFPDIEHMMMTPGAPMGRLLYKNAIQEGAASD